MNDTPREIRDKQREIWLSIPLERRMQIFSERNQMAIAIVKERIRSLHPEYNEAQVFVAYLQEVFPNQYSTEELQKIETWYEGKAA